MPASTARKTATVESARNTSGSGRRIGPRFERAPARLSRWAPRERKLLTVVGCGAIMRHPTATPARKEAPDASLPRDDLRQRRGHGGPRAPRVRGRRPPPRPPPPPPPRGGRRRGWGAGRVPRGAHRRHGAAQAVVG